MLNASYMYPWGYVPYRLSSASIPSALAPCMQDALNLVKQSVQGERNDELFYQHLISLATSQDDQDIIASIRDDERKHNQMFRRIYRDFTGQEVPPIQEGGFEQPSSYLEGIRKALFGELKAVETYRSIKACLPEGAYQSMMFEIITDELKHAAKYNFLFTLNRTSDH